MAARTAGPFAVSEEEGEGKGARSSSLLLSLGLFTLIRDINLPNSDGNSISLLLRKKREGGGRREEEDYLPLAAFVMEVNSVNRAIKELNYTCTVSEVGFVYCISHSRLTHLHVRNSDCL